MNTAVLFDDLTLSPVLKMVCPFVDCASVYLVGGAIRDRIAGQSPRDWDVVINTPRVPVALRERGSPNSLGGIKIRGVAGTLDIWPLADTWAMRIGALKPKPDCFPLSVVFNVDSGILHAETRQGWIDAVVQGFRDRHLTIVLEESLLLQNPTPYRNVAKALWLRARYGLRWSTNVGDYVAWVLGQDSGAVYRVIAEAQARYQGGTWLTPLLKPFVSNSLGTRFDPSAFDVIGESQRLSASKRREDGTVDGG
ncbi:Poly A polymerase head domain-containing protein [Sulfobacillus thermosulfidooxidans DSM 9293]|uniref:Poly A polymerase head domain-containing protein n=1 Tax=Sulfobacillus thermosulfidooxidans (strain DSM 9293 / VKM B-1269 / AT-1) TaxID=929705 RepID=A0A1W1W6W9_SULTA|nr:hypothetical protein [Sulfobacillus thermosulfidooxidans]SMC02026.1 Poly A polymerase head domain-containing protein [Sulfobacillus thermosulfidooxidans DSM 9293]